MLPMAHPKDAWYVCLYTAASQEYRGSIITQIAERELSKPRWGQDHFPLAFISRLFKGSMLKLAKVEKEAFAIMETCKPMEYLLLQ